MTGFLARFRIRDVCAIWVDGDGWTNVGVKCRFTNWPTVNVHPCTYACINVHIRMYVCK